MKTITSLKVSVTLLIFLFVISTKFSTAQVSWNQAANFPGTNGSYIAVANSTSLNITGKFSLEAWIHPTSVAIIAKTIISKSSLLGIKYGMKIQNNRIFIITNSTQRIISRASNPIPLNTWTHVAATYDLTNYKIYINGVLDTTLSAPGTSPSATTDSLFIGTSGSSTEFAGKMDDVRVWNTDLSQLGIIALMKSSLGISGDNFFANLVLSIPFQNNTGESPYFSTMDFSDKQNNGFTRNNITAFNMNNAPSKIHYVNDCAQFAATGAAFTILDHPAISPTNKITFECWLFPKSDNYGIFFKGPFFTSVNYGLNVTAGKLNASINNILITSNDSVKKERWSHIAFTYFGATGAYEFYVNGKRGTTGNISSGNITDGPDSLLIGIFPGSTSFLGFIDEVRISHTIKTAEEINSQMFTSINESNDNDSYTNAVYNFDASTLPSTANSPRMNARGTAGFTYHNALFSDLIESPITNLTAGNFQQGFYMKMPNKRIPSTGTTGTVRDTLEILSPETISDLNIYVALNHSEENNLRLTLTSPLGASVEFFTNVLLADGGSNIVTVFDSDADSSLISGRYVNFGPRIKPQFDIDAIYSGSNCKGKWILTINDDAASDTGFISGWGLQINNKTFLPFNLECTSLMEGFYDPSTNLLIADTARYYLRTSSFPYSIIDSSIAFLNTSGTTISSFTKAQPSTNYFLVVKHRNSIETWSSTAIQFSQFLKQAQYNFTNLQTKAFGDNMKQVDTSPVRYATFSGDENQDGNIDVTDIVNVYNDALILNSGYISTDMNGDDFADAADLIITYNNAINIVGVITP